MHPRRYHIIILDPTGRTLRRTSLPRRGVHGAAAAVILVALLWAGLLTYGLASGHALQQTHVMLQEHQRLELALAHMQRRLPRLRHLQQQAEATLAQVVTKVGPKTIAPTLAKAIEPQKVGSTTEETSLEVPPRSPEAHALAVCDRLSDTLGYFHDAQALLASTPSIRPVQSAWLSSSFGRRRDPISHRWLVHKGLDMAGRKGMRIHAPADGVVIWADTRGGYGQTVVLDHGHGLQTHFAHLSRYLVGVGDTVKRGHAIAEMGSTGRSTGPHLHYEVRRLGEPLDPRRFILN